MTPILPGPNRYEGRNGYIVRVDQQLTPERVDVLTGLMERHGYTPADITEAWFDGEGVVFHTVTDVKQRLGGAT
jgi:hypothetical protein